MNYLAFIVVILTLANLVLSQSISISYSFIDGSPWKGAMIPARFPSGYGVYNSTNTPGGRSSNKMMIYNNLIYSFHGYPSPVNDVWAFNITSKRWSWLAGKSNSGAPTFGTRGVASVSNTPGYRVNFVGDIHRARKEYILFGGSDLSGTHGDLWTFDLISNMWTWLAGSSSLSESPVYNIIGVSTDSTTPGARYTGGSVVFQRTGEFLLYGGYNVQSSTEMWAFNFENLRWTWISGSSAENVGASVGQKGEWSTEYFPGSRASFSDPVLDFDSDILYVFGGDGPEGLLSDLWAFNYATMEWAWISGSLTLNDPGYCGTMGYSNRNNYPGARVHHNMVYHTLSGLLIMFGGFGYSCNGEYGSLSDTWIFNSTSQEWTWIAGSSQINQVPGDFMTLGTQNSCAMAVNPQTLGIYMFGGLGFVSQTRRSIVDYVWFANITAAPLIRFTSSKGTSTESSKSVASSRNLYSLNSAAPTLSLSVQSFSSSEVLRDLVFASNSSSTSGIELIAISTVGVNLSLRTETASIIDNVQNSNTILSRIRFIKYQILAAFLVLLLTMLILMAYKFNRRRKLEDATKTNDDSSMTISSSTFQTHSSTTISTTGQSTLAVSTAGIYLPGGLQVDGTTAYRKNEELVRGGGGSVWLATALEPSLKTHGDLIIVKTPNGRVMTGRAVALFHQEIALMNAFKNNQNIATLLGYSENPYSIVLKYYPNGSLSFWVSSELRTLRQALYFLNDISVGLKYLHSNGVVHCDLKPDNVLIDSGWRFFAVLSDFGISRIVTDKLLNVGAYEVQGIRGASIAYAAPEVLEELRIEKTSHKPTIEIMARDIYSFGMISSFLMRGENAWQN